MATVGSGHRSFALNLIPVPVPFPEAVVKAVEQTLADHPDVVDRWLHNEPGVWGFLAGKCVVACGGLVGGRLSEAERRATWQALWDSLVALRPT